MHTSCTHPTRYPTDLIDTEWALIVPYVNVDPAIGSPRSVCMRCVVNALLYIDTTGCQWQLLWKRYGRDLEPSLAMVDRQSVKTTEVGGDVNFDAGKQVYGRKRHILVDTLGLLLVVVVTAACPQDASSAPAIMPRLGDQFPVC